MRLIIGFALVLFAANECRAAELQVLRIYDESGALLMTVVPEHDWEADEINNPVYMQKGMVRVLVPKSLYETYDTDAKLDVEARAIAADDGIALPVKAVPPSGPEVPHNVITADPIEDAPADAPAEVMP